jgi:hypothetical protein
MQALRQILDVKDNRVSILLPADFKAGKVEVIVLPFDESASHPSIKNSERFSGAISEKTAQKLHQHINEIHNEWERDIY